MLPKRHRLGLEFRQPVVDPNQASLLLKTRGLTYWGRVGFVTLAAFTAGVVCFLPPWIWFRFAADYTLVMMADLTLSGFLLDLVLAKWASPEPA